jgi:hypothetical protein
VNRFVGYLYTQFVTTSSLIITLSLIHTLYRSLERAKSSQFPFTSRFLVTDLNNKNSSASVLTSLLSEYPAIELSSKLCPSYNPPARTAQKTQLFYCCVRVCCRHYLATALFTELPLNNGKVFTEPLRRNGSGVSTHLAAIA